MREKAMEKVASLTGEDLGVVSEHAKYFDNLRDAYGWIYANGANGHSDMLDLIESLSCVTAEQMREVGANNVAEYMALNHDHIFNTVYGVVYLPE